MLKDALHPPPLRGCLPGAVGCRRGRKLGWPCTKEPGRRRRVGGARRPGEDAAQLGEKPLCPCGTLPAAAQVALSIISISITGPSVESQVPSTQRRLESQKHSIAVPVRTWDAQ